MKSYKPKSCVRCGEEFTPRSGYAKYCETCRPIIYREEVAEWRATHHEYSAAYARERRARLKLKLIREILSAAKQYK